MRRSGKLTPKPVETSPEPLMLVTEGDVKWCYRAILGRNPESTEVVQGHAASYKDFRSLVLACIASEEFRNKGPYRADPFGQIEHEAGSDLTSPEPVVAVTDEDVEWCYRAILGRNPESTEVIQGHAASYKDFRSLVLAFIASEEFRNKGPYRADLFGQIEHEASSDLTEGPVVAVTEEDVKWCYRSILGRNPESTEVVQGHAASYKDFRSLVLAFIGCEEFRNKGPSPADPFGQIEHEASADLSSPVPVVAVTEDDVEWCYRSILGRNPESADVVQRHAASHKDFRSLVLAFIGCEEFSKKWPAEPTEPENLLEALRSRIARSAAYFHAFDINSAPFRLAPGTTYSNYTDEKTGIGYTKLANGKADADCGGATDGYGIRVPPRVEAAASGRPISVNVVARAAGCAQSRFAIAYATDEVGNSGWRWQDAGSEWCVFTMDYDVPTVSMGNANGHFVGILPDTEGRPATELCCLSINITEPAESAEFPTDLFDHHWYARDIPPEARFKKGVQHYVEYGARQRCDPNPLLDSKWYARRYHLPADVDPLVHFAQHEKYGQVSPNRHWEGISRNASVAPPRLADLLLHYPKVRKPTYLIGLAGTGRSYIHSLIFDSNLDIAYYLPECFDIYDGAVPVILSGHVGTTYHCDAFLPGNLGRVLIDRTAAGLVNLIFINRHPLDTFLSYWAFTRTPIGTRENGYVTTKYKSKEDFHRDLNDNLYSFSLLCGGSKDFGRIVAGPAAQWTVLSLLEFIHETEVFVSSRNVHCFRLEDFGSNPTEEFKRLVSILAPDLTPKPDNVPLPRSATSHYQSAKENVPSFRALVASLPRDIKKRIEALGYSM